MKFILAPDSFKNCLHAGEVIEALKRGILATVPECDIIACPMADGGEGTVEAFLAIGGARKLQFPTVDPLGRPVSAAAAELADGTAVIEMAAAAGLELLKPEELNPLLASTYGVGLMLRRAVETGKRKFIVGLGGSATVDGGAGMLQALGFRFLTAEGNELAPGLGGGRLTEISRVDSSSVLPELAGCEITLACDVTTVLGDSARIFGPQKGATPEMVETLTVGLMHFSRLWDDDGNCPGDGAAGGLGFAFRKLLHAKSVSGAELLLDRANFDRLCANADFVITGEGRSDSQSAAGKLCGTVARRAGKYHLPVILVSGALSNDFSDPENLYRAVFSIAPGPVSLTEALHNAPLNLERMGRNLAGLLACL